MFTCYALLLYKFCQRVNPPCEQSTLWVYFFTQICYRDTLFSPPFSQNDSKKLKICLISKIRFQSSKKVCGTSLLVEIYNNCLSSQAMIERLPATNFVFLTGIQEHNYLNNILKWGWQPCLKASTTTNFKISIKNQSFIVLGGLKCEKLASTVYYNLFQAKARNKVVN